MHLRVEELQLSQKEVRVVGVLRLLDLRLEEEEHVGDYFVKIGQGDDSPNELGALVELDVRRIVRHHGAVTETHLLGDRVDVPRLTLLLDFLVTFMQDDIVDFTNHFHVDRAGNWNHWQHRLR